MFGVVIRDGVKKSVLFDYKLRVICVNNDVADGRRRETMFHALFHFNPTEPES